MPVSPRASSSRTGKPRLPPISTFRPACLRIWPISAVVVDLPLVPVMPAKRAVLQASASSSMSPMIGTLARRARSATGCGLGWVCGMPGDSTSALAPSSPCRARSVRASPEFCAVWRFSAASSQASTRAPPCFSAKAAANPERASPSTATVSLRKLATGIIASPQLQRGEAGDRQDRGDDPEADDDGRLLPALLFEMVVERRHAEHALAGEFEARHLHDHRHGLEHEQPADDRQHEFVLGDDAANSE